MAIELTDDGTLDTVLRCSECGEEFRFNFAGSPDGEDGDNAYDAFVDSSIEEVEAEHECSMPPDDSEPPEDEPDEDSITTEDHQRFFQYGRLAFELIPLHADDGSDIGVVLYVRHQRYGSYDTTEDAIRAFQTAEGFWPNVFWVSDHGNAHLMAL